jgi:hypothetical protein
MFLTFLYTCTILISHQIKTRLSERGNVNIKVQATLDQSYSIPQTTARSTRLHRLAEMYTFHDAAAVSSFLSAYPHLIEILFEAYPHLLEHFGPGLKVALKVVGDPEAEDSERLFAYLLTSLPPEEALARLDRLDEEWFLDQTDRVGDLFNFNL